MRTPSTATLLRVAAVLTLLYALGHESGAPWTPGTGADAEAVVQAMNSTRFVTEGADRSYGEFYVGFGHLSGLGLLTQAAALWLTARLADRDPSASTGFIAVFLLSTLANLGMVITWFFSIPVIFAAAIAVTLTAALARSRSA